MIGDAVKERIHGAIQTIWLEQVPADYNRSFLLMEDSLKTSFYHHLRSMLGEGWLMHHCLRIYPELRVADGAKVDLAIVRISRAADWTAAHLSDAVEEHVAFIEFKYKAGNSPAPFIADMHKLRAYSEQYPDCMLYAGFVQDAYYDDAVSWLPADSANTWAAGRLTELIGYWDESTDAFVTDINQF